MGIITDIQRFSLNDGPGIRTTVFFKGCNMACDWCHNPEALSGKPELLRYPQKCIHCGACETDENAVCYSGARVWAGRRVSAAEVMEEVLQDTDYYRNSGGGVTLSGGETLMQPEFAAELLHACKENRIQTAVETNLFYPFETLRGLLPFLDLVMCDCKIMDPQKHLAHTGVDNAVILDNIRRLSGTDTPYILRTPVIPGINDTEEEIGAVAAFAAQNKKGLLYYELLNFNPLGVSKYEAMGLENPYAHVKPLDAQRMRELAATAEDYGLPVRIG